MTKLTQLLYALAALLSCSDAVADRSIELEYGKAATGINICLADFAEPKDYQNTITFAAGDVEYIKDGGAATTIGVSASFTANDDCWDFNLTATELECSRCLVKIIDLTATKEWIDTSVYINTFNHPSATIISYDPYRFSAIADATGTVNTTDMTGAASASDDEYKDNVLRLYDASADEWYEAICTGYVGATNICTHSTTPEAMVSGDGIIVLAETKNVGIFDINGNIFSNANLIEGSDATDQINAAVDVALSDINLDHLLPRSGTADSGTPTTMVDAALTEADADYFAKGIAVIFTSGTILDQNACIYNFVPGTDTVTFRPALTQAVSTNTYVFMVNPTCGGVVAL